MAESLAQDDTHLVHVAGLLHSCIWPMFGTQQGKVQLLMLCPLLVCGGWICMLAPKADVHSWMPVQPQLLLFLLG